MHGRSPADIPLLFLVNLSLQLWDGLATYYGVHLGVAEGNPLLQRLMQDWGVGWALVGAKLLTCGLLFCLQRLPHPVVPSALLFTALWYAVFSVVPWGVVFFVAP
jgi:hypothetical protein